MIDLLVKIIGPLLKVHPVPPHIPAGARDVEVFKASPRYLNYRYLVTAVRLSVVGFIGTTAFGLISFAAVQQNVGWVGALLSVIFGLIFGALIAVSLVALKLDYEYHYYVITDRSLRIRRGIWAQLEVTLTYANVQNVRVEQGPLERMFGIASVIVETAGGKVGENGQAHIVPRGMIAGIENAQLLREKIMRRVGQDRSTGLGDHDDHRPDESPTLDRALLVEIRDEARKLALC